MSKSIAEVMREFIDRMDEVSNRNYDMEMEIENWRLDDLDTDDESIPSYINLGIDYNVEGSYSPATWGDQGGEPEEYPELDYKVYDVDTGQEITDIPEKVDSYIEEKIWDHINNKEPDFNEPDRDSRY